MVVAIKHTLIFIVTLLLTSIVCSATTRDVCPTCQYKTIYEAMTAARSNDLIRVVAGNYNEQIYFNDTKSLRVIGGYSPDFSVQDPELYPTKVINVFVSYYNVGDAIVDGFEISGSSSQGVSAWAPRSTLSVSNCTIHDNFSSGILVSEIMQVTVVGNKLWSNGDYASIYITDDKHSKAVITDNIVYGNRCQYCSGINLYNAKSADIISRNIAYDNSTGILVRAYMGTEAPLVEWNQAYENAVDGISIMGGTPLVNHNVSYNNGGIGMLYSSPFGGSFLHNVLSGNGREGFYISGNVRGAPQPIIKNNVFSYNANGLYLSGSLNGWGSTDLKPIAEYNAFFANQMSELVHSGEYPWGFEEETPGSYGELNGPAWSNYNIYHDPGFVDAENGDFRLKPDSFLIDEGVPTDSASKEPLPNGGRVNIGLYGNTADAELSPAIPQVQNLVSRVTDDDVAIAFDTNTASASYWVRVFYKSGNLYYEVPAANLNGLETSKGQKGLRIKAGQKRELTWSGGAATIAAVTGAQTLRVMLEHGNESGMAEALLSAPCNTVATAEIISLSAVGGIPSLVIDSNCAWRVESDVGWITLEANAGSGNKVLYYSVGKNEGSEARTGHITIGKTIISISQAGAVCTNCSVILTPSTPTPVPTPTSVPTIEPTSTPLPIPTNANNPEEVTPAPIATNPVATAVPTRKVSATRTLTPRPKKKCRIVRDRKSKQYKKVCS